MAVIWDERCFSEEGQLGGRKKLRVVSGSCEWGGEGFDEGGITSWGWRVYLFLFSVFV